MVVVPLFAQYAPNTFCCRQDPSEEQDAWQEFYGEEALTNMNNVSWYRDASDPSLFPVRTLVRNFIKRSLAHGAMRHFQCHFNLFQVKSFRLVRHAGLFFASGYRPIGNTIHQRLTYLVGRPCCKVLLSKKFSLFRHLFVWRQPWRSKTRMMMSCRRLGQIRQLDTCFLAKYCWSVRILNAAVDLNIIGS